MSSICSLVWSYRKRKGNYSETKHWITVSLICCSWYNDGTVNKNNKIRHYFFLCPAKLNSRRHCALWLSDSTAGFRGQKTSSIITSIFTGLEQFNAGCWLSLQSCSFNPSAHSLQQNMAHFPNSHSLPSLPLPGGPNRPKNPNITETANSKHTLEQFQQLYFYIYIPKTTECLVSQQITHFLSNVLTENP